MKILLVRVSSLGDVKLARPIKIAVDCGNGVAGAFAGDLFRGMAAR